MMPIVSQSDYFKQETASVNQRFVIRSAQTGRFRVEKSPTDYPKSGIRVKVERYVKKRSG